MYFDAKLFAMANLTISSSCCVGSKFFLNAPSSNSLLKQSKRRERGGEKARREERGTEIYT